MVVVQAKTISSSCVVDLLKSRRSVYTKHICIVIVEQSI